MSKTILTCAVTGNLVRPDQTPYLPITPEQIATAAIEAAEAGAAVVHIHVRDPKTGAPSMEIALYREVMERIRDSGRDLIINLTTGPGGRFVPGEADPSVAGPGTNLRRPEQRVAHIVELKPEICTLDLNTMNSAGQVVINTPGSITAMAKAMMDAGVKPELEVFDSGDIHIAHDLLASGALPKPPLFQIVTGVKYGFSADPRTLFYASSLLPAGATWAAFGIGRMSFPMVAQSFLLGGHCRVGLEDAVHIARGKLAKSNAELVERAVAIIQSLNGELASPADAREILGLPPRHG